MKLGIEVGIGPGHIVLHREGPSFPQKGHSPPNFRPMSVVAKRLDDQDATWYGGSHRPRRMYTANPIIFIAILPTFQTLSSNRVVWHCLRDPTFSCFSRTLTCDRQTDR